MLSDVMDEQLKALWFSPFHSDELETDLDMVCVAFPLYNTRPFFIQLQKSNSDIKSGRVTPFYSCATINFKFCTCACIFHCRIK